MTSRRLTLAAAVALLVAAGLLPVLAVVVESVTAGGRLSLDAYARVFSEAHAWLLLARTIGLASVTTVVAVVIGVPLGVLLGKSDLPLRRPLTGALVVPFLLPPYVLALGWADALGPEGVAAHLSGGQASRALSAALFGFPGCVLVLASAFMPLVLILTITSLRAVSRQLEEAGRLAGSWAVVLRGVTLPLAAPGIALAAMLVFLLTTGAFGVPLFLRYEVFAVESFTQFSAFLDYGAATAAALPLVAVVVLVLGLEGVLVRDKTYDLRPAAGEPLVIALGWWRLPALVAVGMVGVLTLVLPLGALIARAASVEAFRQAIGHGGPSLLRSVLYSAMAATLLTAVGFLLGYLVRHRAFAVWRGIDSLTLFLFVLPGTVLGIGLAAMWNRPVVGAVYASPLIVIVGYLAQYVAIPSRITVAALSSIPPTMEEAAQTVGVGWLRRVFGILLPLVRPGLVAAWLVSFLFCLRDLGVTMLVYPAGGDTLPVRTFTLMANGAPGMIAALCVLLVATALIPMTALAVVGARFWGTS